ncbi:hypothetical protein UO65_0048 [Actinokineospora spheciospongiae]|uniref:Cytochrome P450 n=1 Tax=Actinokineospora spheciospongiae TaxID=909613 RepID=W7J603_9PSEU|nr:cytochrome P450 [Actinokineospora spheciospongiae]EWC64441.1 hypothetical protein UO65_0048 [Actinokineospora spheciospongiae]PWW60234.1 cytochrome P450 [Actinokineospora spheciospongiae]
MSAPEAIARGAVLPGVLAHHDGPCPVTGHRASFHEATVVRGRQPTEYFADTGVAELAAAAGGVCTFWMGDTPAVYQMTNAPLVPDSALAPSTDLNRDMFGDFMGSLNHDDPRRPAKRRMIEATLGSTRFVESLEPHIARHAEEYLRPMAGRQMPIDRFATGLVAHVDSHLPGVLDLTQRPLTAYLTDPLHRRAALEFFEIASRVIGTVDPDAMREFDSVADFIRDLLVANADAIAAAPATNLVRGHFALWGLPFDRTAAQALDPVLLKELGTSLVAVYDTSALSLTWALTCLGACPAAHRAVAESACGGVDPGPVPVVDLAVVEAVRWGGSNPTALWRCTTEPVEIRHRGRAGEVPAGTMLWLDRSRANRDPAVFPVPDRFDLANPAALVRSDRETVSSLLSRSRYEINSFSMVNTTRNPRKCPGRLFSVRVQSVLLRTLHANYDVEVRDADPGLRPASAMPRPAEAGLITLTPRPVNPRGGRA